MGEFYEDGRDEKGLNRSRNFKDRQEEDQCKRKNP